MQLQDFLNEYYRGAWHELPHTTLVLNWVLTMHGSKPEHYDAARVLHIAGEKPWKFVNGHQVPAVLHESIHKVYAVWWRIYNASMPVDDVATLYSWS
jgi:hypothetical protein